MPKSLKQFRLATARRLRERSTEAERRLWRELRKMPVYGTHFRRQVSLGSFVVDFACQRAKLIIEVDGSQHAQRQNIERDSARTAWLEAEGYRVLRFWNSDVLKSPANISEQIYATLHGELSAEPKSFDHPTPAHTYGARRPSPSRGG